MKTKIGVGEVVMKDDDFRIVASKNAESDTNHMILFSNHNSGVNYSFLESQLSTATEYSSVYNIIAKYKGVDCVENLCEYINEHYFSCETTTNNIVLSDVNTFRLLSIIRTDVDKVKSAIELNNLKVFKDKHNLNDEAYEEIRNHFATIG